MAREVKLDRNNFDRYFQDDGRGSFWSDISPYQLRRENEQAWKVVAEAEFQSGDGVRNENEFQGESDPQKIFHYILLQKNGAVYLTYGAYDENGEWDPEESRSNIQRIYYLEEIGNLEITAHTEGIAEYHSFPSYYPEGFDFDYDEVMTTAILDSGTLFFDAGWNTTTLVVGEDYYSYPNESECFIERETYELKRNAEGRFALEVFRRNDVRDEKAFYFIQGEDGGKYVIRVLYPLDKSGMPHW